MWKWCWNSNNCVLCSFPTFSYYQYPSLRALFDWQHPLRLPRPTDYKSYLATSSKMQQANSGCSCPQPSAGRGENGTFSACSPHVLSRALPCHSNTAAETGTKVPQPVRITNTRAASVTGIYITNDEKLILSHCEPNLVGLWNAIKTLLHRCYIMNEQNNESFCWRTQQQRTSAKIKNKPKFIKISMQKSDFFFFF